MIGIRLVVHFIGDIYTIRNLIVNNSDYQIVKEKDYVRNTKETGYRGYHIIIDTETDGFKIASLEEIQELAKEGKFLHYASIESVFKGENKQQE